MAGKISATGTPFISTVIIIESLFEKSGSGSITRRKGAQKRSIYGICEHFETLSNAVSGP
jgi:hypothetical protein